MPRNHEFAREDKFPSWFANRIQDFLAGAETRLQLLRKSATVIEIAPDPHLGCAAVLIEGRWRVNTAAIERALSGAKGTYTIWAVAEDNLINNTPNPFTDHTVYTFDLRFTTGAAPTGTGIAISTKIGEVDWSGSAIEALRQTHASVSGAQIMDGALAAGTDIEWKREPSGALVPFLKKEGIAEDRLIDKSVSSRKFKPTTGEKVVKENLAPIGASYTDLVLTGGNLTIKPAVASWLKVTASFRWQIGAGASGADVVLDASCFGTLNVDGADNAKVSELFLGLVKAENVTAAWEQTTVQSYLIALTANEEHTIKMRAKKVSGASVAGVIATSSGFIYELIGS